MGRIVGRILLSIFLVGAAWSTSPALAQQDEVAEQERAIAAHETSLTALTREALPREWAATQDNLGVAYRNRISGDRADNLEKAIAVFEAALTVFTREAMPREWAQTQRNLGLAYWNRVRGDRADNLEKAIAAYEAALSVQTREASPLEWAATQNDLGVAYWVRIRGERAENLEKAIALCEEALSVRTREALPFEWAQTQDNLGLVYSDRIRGDRADNLEKAIAAFEAALTMLTRESLPRQWGATQNNLGLAYSNRIYGDRAENLERAISLYETALTALTREALPREWAATQDSLGVAYRNRIRGDRADNLEKAIAVFEAALTVFTRETMPREWAKVQGDLGLAYRERIRGDRGGNLEKAIAVLKAALSVQTREALPRDHLRTGLALGTTLLQLRKWEEASFAYSGAREAFLVLFGQGLDEAEGRDLVTAAGPLFAEAAFAAAEQGGTEMALALASEGKARLLAVALKLEMLELPVDKRSRLDELRAAIRAEERVAEATQGMERESALDKLAAYRNELLDIIKSANPGETGSSSTLARVRALLPAGALLVPLVTKVGAKILIVTAGEQGINVLDLPELTSEKLDVLIRGERKDGKTGGWLGAYNINYIVDESELDRRWPEWTSAILDLGPALWNLGGKRLEAALKERGVKPGARLIWMPTGALGILPVGLAQDPVSKRRIGEEYEVVYAPSLEALTAEQRLIAKQMPASLAAIINPTGDLAGTEKEGAIVASHFANTVRTLLQTQAATPDAVLAALKGRTYWHFASHGKFSWQDARGSALIMNGMVPLTVGRLSETDGLGQPRLVVLSACETGLYDIDHNPDEFVGLPGAFAALGAAGVVSTLWPVSDDATALLMAKFYELHREAGLAPPTALARAQAWLREGSNEALTEYARVAARQGRIKQRHLAEIERALSAEGLKRQRNRALVQWMKGEIPTTSNRKQRGNETSPDAVSALARPYSHPYYWAGFIYTGS